MKTRRVAFIDWLIDWGPLPKSGFKTFALTYQWISKRFPTLWVCSIVEFGWARHHGKLHRRTALIHHPEELLNQARELRMSIQLLLERHGDALKGDIVMGGANAPRSDEVCVLRWQKSHFFGDDVLHIGYNGYALHWHPEFPQRSCQKATVGVHCVTLTDDSEENDFKVWMGEISKSHPEAMRLWCGIEVTQNLMFKTLVCLICIYIFFMRQG